MHAVLVDMMRTSSIDMSQTVNLDDIDAFLTNAAWTSPGTAIFGWDMLFDIPYIADWNAIGRQ